MWSGYHALISIIQRRLTPSTYTFEVKMGYLRRQTCFARFHDEHPSDYSDFIRLLACFIKRHGVELATLQKECSGECHRQRQSTRPHFAPLIPNLHPLSKSCAVSTYQGSVVDLGPRRRYTAFTRQNIKNGTFLTGQRTIICIKVRWCPLAAFTSTMVGWFFWNYSSEIKTSRYERPYRISRLFQLRYLDGLDRCSGYFINCEPVFTVLHIRSWVSHYTRPHRHVPKFSIFISRQACNGSFRCFSYSST